MSQSLGVSTLRLLCALLTLGYLCFYSLKFLDCRILNFSCFFQLGKILFYMHRICVIFLMRNFVFPIKEEGEEEEEVAKVVLAMLSERNLLWIPYKILGG